MKITMIKRISTSTLKETQVKLGSQICIILMNNIVPQKDGFLLILILLLFN